MKNEDDSDRPSEAEVQAKRLEQVKTQAGYQEAIADLYASSGGYAYLAYSRLTLAIDRLVFLLEHEKR